MKSEGQKPDRSTQHLANERTFLAWLRTSIVLVGLGFVIVRFSLLLKELGSIADGASSIRVTSHLPSNILGISVVAFGIGLTIYAVKNYFDAYKAIESGGYVSKHTMIYVASIGLVIFGLAEIAYLVLLLL